MLFTRWLNGLSFRFFRSRRRLSRRGSGRAKRLPLRPNSWIASLGGSDSSGLIRAVECLEDRSLLSATVTTDLADYAPGATVYPRLRTVN